MDCRACVRVRKPSMAESREQPQQSTRVSQVRQQPSRSTLAVARALLAQPALTRGVRIARVVALVASLLLGAYWLVDCVDAFYPVKLWLIWRYAGYWAGAAFYTLACQMAGLPIVERLGRDFRASERLLLGQATGMVVFFVGMFVLGLLGLYTKPVFFLWPLTLMALGAPTSFRVGKRLWRLRRAMFARPRAPMPPLRVLAYGLSLVSLLIIYSQIVHPLNTSFDARWYHLSLAEQYAAHGRLLRFPNASFVNAYPQLVSFLYTWAFLAPSAVLFDKVELCAHLVFVMFGWILFGVGLLTRRLVPRAPPTAWCVVFLFPGLFLYDSGLHLGSDHAAALFAVPLLLTGLLAVKSWQTRNWLLLSLMVSGVTLTKYSAVTLLAAPAFVIALVGFARLALGWREPRKWLAPPAWAAILALGLTALHWAKNWLFYGDPVLPYASDIFKQPWAQYPHDFYATWAAIREWMPKGDFHERLHETLHAVPLFAFVPHDWEMFHHDVPVFGFLFSLTGLALPFVRGRTGRIWLLLAATYCGIFLWYWGMHQDRYLQILLPWMASVTAAILTLAWRSSFWAKAPVLLLIVLQIAWGSDVPFIPGHTMLDKVPTVMTIDLASTGFRKAITGRLNVFEPWQSMAKALDARTSCVLVHEQQLTLGIGTMVLQDSPHMQSQIDYGSQQSLGGVYRMLKQMGVTHVVWTPGHASGWFGYANDFVFLDFVRDHASATRSFGGYYLAPLTNGPDLDLRAAKVAYLGCPGGGYRRGLYSLTSMSFPDIVTIDLATFPKPEILLAHDEQRDDLIRAARYVAFDSSCSAKMPRALSEHFERIGSRSSIDLWARNDRRLSE